MKYQFVKWFPEWRGIGFIRLNEEKTDMVFNFRILGDKKMGKKESFLNNVK